MTAKKTFLGFILKEDYLQIGFFAHFLNKVFKMTSLSLLKLFISLINCLDTLKKESFFKYKGLIYMQNQILDCQSRVIGRSNLVVFLLIGHKF